MAAPMNSGVNTGNTSYSTVTFSPNLVNSAQLATGAQVNLEPDHISSALPEFDDSLGDHVPQQIRLKVWDDQYINFYSLLPDKEENTILDNESSPLVILKSGQIGLGHRSSTLKKVSNIGQWTDAFMIFASIYLQKYQNVQMALDLLKYCSTIRWAASKVPGPAWRQYDEQFRLRRAKKPSKSWARLDLDLWLLFISASTPLNNPSQKFNIGTKELADKPKVNKLLEGLRRSGKSKDTRAPITLPILTQLPRALVCICFSSYEAKLFHAAFTLAFFGFLRVGEIALSNCKSNSSTVLSISDISIQNSMLKVKIRFSKTDQFGKTTTLYIDSVPSSVVCPVNAMKAYLSVRPAASNILFCHSDCKPLTQYQFSSVLKKCLKFLNLPTQQFKSHSFRIGAASLASMKNIPPNVIQSWGRWKSDAYRGYIHIWIVGSSIVYWAQRRALSRPVGRNLGLEKYGVQIRWCGIRGMKWSQLLTRIQRDLRNFPCPQYLVIQLRWEMKLDILSLSKLPNTTVVWSCILPRLFWYGARSQVAIDNVRKRTNREISSYILKLGGRVITQSDLSDKETGCYRFDGIHLSDIGNDIYLNALQGALESFLIKDIHCNNTCRCFIGHSSLIGLFVKLDIYKITMYYLLLILGLSVEADIKDSVLLGQRSNHGLVGHMSFIVVSFVSCVSVLVYLITNVCAWPPLNPLFHVSIADFVPFSADENSDGASGGATKKQQTKDSELNKLINKK
ncbi:hypothetical protein KUTeg_014489 [Tegillarca granosa]|uniref:Tyr recombinase domain-containing protein n=1 Tax=Tegillarca granosa TaxID=220873 RepID=A0ABQ9ERT7_TEGGR|nr:hypothetical protein KUTeg_014489 [Tegillarca granosa]